MNKDELGHYVSVAGPAGDNSGAITGNIQGIKSPYPSQGSTPGGYVPATGPGANAGALANANAGANAAGIGGAYGQPIKEAPVVIPASPQINYETVPSGSGSAFGNSGAGNGNYGIPAKDAPIYGPSAPTYGPGSSGISKADAGANAGVVLVLVLVLVH